MRQTLGWTEKDEDGKKIEVEAFRERNHWTFTRRSHRTEEWEAVPSPPVSYWEQLLDLLNRKYQRRRCAWKDVEEVQAFLDEALKKEPGV